jgi:phosphoserine phosphatase
MARRVDFRPIQGQVSFYLLRHGESEGNREAVMQGRNPSPLTPRGREQAREAGLWFRGRGLDCVLTSPLERARVTAEAVAEAAGIGTVETAEELTEIDIGIFTNMSLAQARERHPVQYARFMQESWEGVEGAERIDALYARALAAWKMLFQRVALDKRSILAVTHSGFLQWLIRSTLGLKSWMPLFSASDNCCVSHLLVDNQPLGITEKMHLQRRAGSGEGAARSHYASWMLVNAPVVLPSR